MNTETMRTEEMLRACMKKIEGDFGTMFTEEERENTPKRILKVFEEFKKNQEFEFTVFDNTDGYENMVILKVERFYSLCSHHLLPFFGEAYIGYIPKEKICGISKLERMVKKHASKPQIQERLTKQIYEDLKEKLETEDIIVILKATHLCMEMRGTKATKPVMTTSAVGGAFWNAETRQEFLELIK